MMKKTLLTASIVALTISGSAIAAKQTTKDSLTGFYIGLDGGYSSASIDSSVNKTLLKEKKLLTNDPIATGVRLGYTMPINNHFRAGGELNSYTMGSQTVTDAKALNQHKMTANNIGLEAVAQYNYDPNNYLEAKLGAARSTVKNFGESYNKINPVFDLGVGTKINTNVVMTGELKYLIGDRKLGTDASQNAITKPAPVISILFGITYHY